jgi:predicted transcriptional regulator
MEDILKKLSYTELHDLLSSRSLLLLQALQKKDGLAILNYQKEVRAIQEAIKERKK